LEQILLTGTKIKVLVAVHCTQAYRRNRLRSALILTLILDGNDLSYHIPDTLPPEKETSGTHSVSGWVDARGGADVRGRQKYLELAENATPDRPALHLVPISTTSSELLCYRVKIFF
jgi:hypothetical protein